MKEQYLENQYLEDKKGYFNKQTFEKTGYKFRPIDIINGRIVIVNQDLMIDREFRRKNGENKW